MSDPIFSFNGAQIVYIILVISGFSFVYGRKFYKEHKKKQADRQHRRDWRTKR